MHEGCAGFRQDPEVWQACQDEIALWDSALNDGLEDAEPKDAPEATAINGENARSQGR